ncbi:MAG: sigma 54-interacting transcriptional regulator, partial [Myxococcales bacterium]|nr:sigma 54-interacting transcriptional regulator [Myxococcales bacterium]
EMSLSMQTKLLRVLEDGMVRPVGTERAHKVDVRIIAATHRDLEADVAAGRFRADLYHRLAGYTLRSPALRERGEDVLHIAAYIIGREAPLLGLRAPTLTPEARRWLLEQRWPGNVRELEHALTRACLLAGAGGRAQPCIEVGHLLPPGEASRVGSSVSVAGEEQLPADFGAAVDDYRRHLLLRAITEHEGNWAGAARALGLDRSNFHRLAKRLGL